MKKKNIKNLSLNKKAISKLGTKSIKGGTLFPSMFPCLSIDWCPTIKCTEGRTCGDQTAPI